VRNEISNAGRLEIEGGKTDHKINTEENSKDVVTKKEHKNR
jgi:hypothetical protein